MARKAHIRIAGLAIATAAAVLVLGLLGGRLLLPEPPLPRGSENVHRRQPVLGVYSHTRFELCEPFPGNSALEELVRWAATNGWQRVPHEQEDWAAWEWQSFEDTSGPQPVLVDQLLAHWVSPHRCWSLRLVLRYERRAAGNERGCQRGYIIVEPRRYMRGLGP
jgi:hypothetical protein